MTEPRIEMKAEKRARLEKLGYRIYEDAADWLGLTDEEKRLLDLRMSVTQAVRDLRTSLGLTQAQLAEKLGSTQPRIANLELGQRGFSMDFAVKALLAMGGEVTITAKVPKRRKVKPAAPKTAPVS